MQPLFELGLAAGWARGDEGQAVGAKLNCHRRPLRGKRKPAKLTQRHLGTARARIAGTRMRRFSIPFVEAEPSTPRLLHRRVAVGASSREAIAGTCSRKTRGFPGVLSPPVEFCCCWYPRWVDGPAGSARTHRPGYSCSCRREKKASKADVASAEYRSGHRILESNRAARSFSSSGRQGSAAIRSRQARSNLRLSRSLEAANVSRSVRYFSGSLTADRVRASAQFCPSNSLTASSIVLVLVRTIVTFFRSLISLLFSEVPCN